MIDSDLESSWIDFFGRCLRCGAYVESSGGCTCSQGRVIFRTATVIPAGSTITSATITVPASQLGFPGYDEL